MRCSVVPKLFWCLHLQLHPLLILLGFIVLGGEGSSNAISVEQYLLEKNLIWFLLFFILDAAIISFKVLPLRKEVKKLIHLALHAIALILGIIGIYAAFKFHNESNIANLYSLHSWIGIGIAVLYGIQVKIHVVRRLCIFSDIFLFEHVCKSKCM